MRFSNILNTFIYFSFSNFRTFLRLFFMQYLYFISALFELKSITGYQSKQIYTVHLIQEYSALK